MTAGEAERRPPTPRILGRFAVVWSRSGRVTAPGEWPDVLRAATRRLELPGAGCWLTAFEGQEVAADAAAMVAKIGVVRDADGGRLLTAAELSRRGLATPLSIDGAALTGNGLVLAVDLREPRLAAYATIQAIPQLYWAKTADGFVAASDLGLILPLLDRVEIDEDVLPSHFLLRFVPGERTYFRGVKRITGGDLVWVDRGEVSTRRLRVLRDVVAGLPRFDRIDEASLAWIDGVMGATTERWVEEAEARGLRTGNLLSGGLDSSLIQAWCNDLGSRVDSRSWSFAIDTPSFDYEQRYAREASALLGTEHHFVPVRPEEYLELFDRAIVAVASPSLYNEAWPCWVALGEALRVADAPTVMLAGNGADALHGFSDLRAVAYWRQLANRPGLRAKLLARLPELRRRPSAEAWVDALEMQADPASLRDPASFMSIAGELDIAVPAFGEAALFEAFEVRRQIEREQFGSDDLFERLQTMEVVAGSDPMVSLVQLLGSEGTDALQVYMDEAAIAAPFAFAPEIRYLRGRKPWYTRPKPLQQALLERRGLGAIVGRKKGSTCFTDDLWHWYTEGVLRERVEAVERPDWLPAAQFAELKRRPTYIFWNLFEYDAFRRLVVAPAAAAAAARAAG